jgi:hypothetical protein
MIATNLSSTILTNTTRVISICVDDMLRALCQEGSEDGPNLSNKQLLGCNEIAGHQISIPSEVILVCNLSDSSNASIVKASITSTREMLREMILYFMDSEFPRFPVLNAKIAHCLHLKCMTHFFNSY